MGREYVSVTETHFPEKCPECGSRRFKAETASKIIHESIFEWDKDGSVREVEAIPIDQEWQVILGLECEQCGTDLSELIGL